STETESHTVAQPLPIALGRTWCELLTSLLCGDVDEHCNHWYGLRRAGNRRLPRTDRRPCHMPGQERAEDIWTSARYRADSRTRPAQADCIGPGARHAEV